MHASALTPSATGLWWHSPQGSLDHPKISFSISLMLSERGSQALTEHFPAFLRGFLATETLQMQTLWLLLFISLSWPTSGVMNQDKKLAYSDTSQLLRQNLFKCQSALPFTMKPNGFQLAIMSHLITKALVIILH